MKELNIYYRAFRRDNPDGETQLLNVMVTDEAAETIIRALHTDRDSFLDTFSGQSIFKHGESRPYTYARNGGFALELEAVEDVTDQDHGLTFVGLEPEDDIAAFDAPEYAGGE